MKDLVKFFPNMREACCEELSLSLLFERITGDKLEAMTGLYREMRLSGKRNLAEFRETHIPVIMPCFGTGLLHLRYTRLVEGQDILIVDALRDVPHVVMAFQGLEPGSVEVLVRYNSQGFDLTENSVSNYLLYEEATKECDRYLMGYTQRHTVWTDIKAIAHKMFVCHAPAAFFSPDATCLAEELAIRKEQRQHEKDEADRAKAEQKKAAKEKADCLKTKAIMDFIARQPLRYDVIKRVFQIEDGGQWRDITDRNINTLMQKCAIECGFDIMPSVFRANLFSDSVRQVHPLREYILSLSEWDQQTDYIGQVADMVHVTSDRLQWKETFRKWFVAMVASWMHDGVVNHTILSIMGPQGIYKTTFLDSLLPPVLQRYGCKMSVNDRIDRDDRITAAEYGLINIDELDKLKDRELNAIKSLTSTPGINERQPYGIVKEYRDRIASYVASGNNEKFLTDETGNRRFLPFYAESIDSPYENPMPYEGMYAQAYWLAGHGFRYWFDETEIKGLEAHVNEFKVMSLEEELLTVYFKPCRKGDEGAKALRVAEIASRLARWGSIPYSIDTRKLGTLLKKYRFEQVRKGEDGARYYLVIELDSQQIESNHKLNAL